MEETTFLIIGSGIAGVSCAESLAFLSPDESVVLISASPLVKAVTNLMPLTKMLQQFDVEERSAETLTAANPNVKIIQDTVIALDSTLHLVYTKLGTVIKYKKLCICTGAVPKLIPSMSPYIVGIRDTESVKDFQRKVQKASRIVVVGNGGIATEIVHELTGVEIVWVIKDSHISATFIDPGAGEFFEHRLLKTDKNARPTTVKRMKFTVKDSEQSDQLGAALGPDWHSKYDLKGTLQSDAKVKVEYKSEIQNILTPEEVKEKRNEDLSWPVFVELTNGSIYGCDLIVSATGVIPNSKFEMKDGKDFDFATDSGIKVNWKMETNLEDIYAAGDVCTPSWERAAHWFQMRLWTQARQMGMYSAKVMVASLKNNEEVYQDFCFEMFTHVTKFFGYKVVLLGLFNGQTLNNDYELLLRMTRNVEYVKLVMKNGRLQGAVLIGETDLEEMCENLILDQLDLSEYGEDLLNPDIDIEDYFD